MSLLTQNVKKTFKKLTIHNRKFEANTNPSKFKGKGVVINDKGIQNYEC